MRDVAVRLLVAAAATAGALLVALWARVRRRRAAAAAPLDLSGFPGRLVLFTDAGCRRCDGARAVLAAAGADFTEAAFDLEPERVRAAGVTAVPLLVGRNSAGAEVGRIAGRLDRRALDRLLARMG